MGVLRTGVVPVPVPSLSDTQQPSLNLAEKPNAPSSWLILGEDKLSPLLLRLIARVLLLLRRSRCCVGPATSFARFCCLSSLPGAKKKNRWAIP